ncbi:MAG: hypothetical protein ACOYMS_03405 [Terrimicrobiaceae bacterium]
MKIQRTLRCLAATALAIQAIALSHADDVLLVVDTAQHRIFACNLASKQLDLFADLDAFDVVGAPDGALFASRTATPTISKLDREGNVIADWTVPEARSAYGLAYENDHVWANIGAAEGTLACFSATDGRMETSVPWGERSDSMRGLSHSDSTIYGASFGNSVVKSVPVSLHQPAAWVESKSARAVDVLISESGERFVSYQGAPADGPNENESYPPGVYSDMSPTPIVSGFVPFGLAEAGSRLYVSDVSGSIRVFDIANNFVELERIDLPTGVRPGMLCVISAK